MSVSSSHPTAAIRLYGYWRSSCTYRIRIILNVKSISYETVPIHLVRNEHQTEDHTHRSPMRGVPALEIDGVTLSQSGAIAAYLDETRGGPPLMPRGDTLGAALTRARIRAIVDAIGCDIQPIGNLKVLRYVMAQEPPESTKESREAVRDAWSVKWITEGLMGVEALVSLSAGLCCVGDEVTMADAWLIPQLYNAARVGIPVDRLCPTLTRVAAHLATLPAFEQAHPSKQPDAE